jgi:HD-like signal output (HDOD) protein
MTTLPARIANVNAAISSTAVDRLVGDGKQIPAISSTYARLSELSMAATTSTTAIANTVARDPMIAAKVLHLVNSAAFGRKTGSINEAVSLLGIEMLKHLVLGASVFQAMKGFKTVTFSLELFQASALDVATLARRFAPRPQGEVAFTVGLLHDLGKLVLAANEPTWPAIAKRAEMEGLELHLLELEALGTTHAEVGAALLSKWQIPFEIVEAIAFHHRTAQMPDEACALLAAVHAADALYGIVKCAEPESQLDVALLERANTLEQLSGWRHVVTTQFK